MSTLVAACIVTACQAPAEGPREAPVIQATPPTRTPGMCGWLEETDAGALAACRSLALRPQAPPTDSLLPGECGYYQGVHLDSLRACLDRSEALASECPLVGDWSVRQADGQVRRAEWRRCGTEETTYPRHHVLLRAGADEGSPVVFAIDNTEEEGIHGFADVTAADLDQNGTDEVFLLDAVYGTGAIFETCALTVRESGRILCWSAPDFSLDSLALREGETLYKGWIPVPGPPTDVGGGPLLIGPGRTLWYFTPVYAVGDPNCCSSVGASLWLEARPVDGRFETAQMLRVQEDSLGAVVSIDIVRH